MQKNIDQDILLNRCIFLRNLYKFHQNFPEKKFPLFTYWSYFLIHIILVHTKIANKKS